MPAHQPDLVAVEDRRGAGERRLEEHRQERPSRIAAEDGPQPRRVVRSDDVELDGDDVRVVGVRELDHRVRERRPVERPHPQPVFVMGGDDPHVEVGAADEAQDRLAERVVHQGVESVAAQPLGCHPPDLADQVRIRADRPAAAAELLPERLVVDLGRNVESPAVDPEAEPVLRDGHQELADLGVGGVELGQGRQVPPGLVAELGRGVPGGG